MRKLVVSLWSQWKTFWFDRFDPLPLALFRIALGTLILWMFICLYTSWERYYAMSGVLSINNPALPASEVDWWSIFYWTRSLLPVQAIWCLGLGASVGFTNGWQTRTCTILLYIIVTSMIHSNRWVINGEDLVFRMLLFYGCFATLDQTLSIDHWRKTRRPATTEISPSRGPVAWPIRLMQINIVLVYAISLPNKLMDDIAWRNGNAIYLAMVSNMWSRFPWPGLFYSRILSKLFTYGTIVVEATVSWI